MSEPAPEKPVLEKAVPEHDYLLRLAASDLGRAYKSLAAVDGPYSPVEELNGNIDAPGPSPRPAMGCRSGDHGC